MKGVLDPLVVLPGVRRALVIGADGLLLGAVGAFDRSLDPDAFAAQLVGWVVEVERAIDPMAWSTPEQLVLEGSHGAVLLQRAERAWIAVEAAPGAALRDLAVPLEAAVGRLHRLARGLDAPAAPLPSRGEAPRDPDPSAAGPSVTEPRTSERPSAHGA